MRPSCCARHGSDPAVTANLPQRTVPATQEMIAGRYRVLRQLARGSSGQVHALAQRLSEECGAHSELRLSEVDDRRAG
jgi:hypothetical protein